MMALMFTALTKRYEAIKSAAGAKWVVIGLLVSLFVARLDWIYEKGVQYGWIQGGPAGMIFGFPSWILGITAALGFIAWWMTENVIRLKEQIKDARVELSMLRKTGVKLRNLGQALFSEEDFREWKKKTLDWHKDVYESIKKLSVADGEWWDVMDSVPEPREPPEKLFKTRQEDHRHRDRYMQHDFQLRRLGEMIRDLWGRH